MLDENLPTFQVRQSSDPLSSIVYFSQNGSEPEPEYVFRRANPATNPAARKKYAVALLDPHASDVVYAEVVVTPEWQQPTLSAAEIRAQQSQNTGPLAPVPIIPDSFTIQLYDPDQTVNVKYVPGSLTKSDSWEFEMLAQSFKTPSNSQLDRQNQNGEPRADFRPRIMFRWKKDGKLTKDMTCFNVGKSLGKHKSKEPDITVALFKQGRETAVTVYEPNLQRVEMEDRKGLDIVLVLGAEVIRDFYLTPEKRPDLFNIGGGAAPVLANGKRKNSRPSPPPAGPGPTTAMSGALSAPPPVAVPTMSTANVTASSSSRPSAAQIDAETERLKAMVEREERERQAVKQREARERERRDMDEQKRIKKMLDDEEKEKRRHEAEVAQETERLKRLYGVAGQDLPSGGPATQQHSSSTPQPPQQQPQGGGWFGPPPQRPVSVGPGSGPFHISAVNNSLGGRPFATPAPRPPNQESQGQAGPSRPGRKPTAGPYLSGNAAAAVSGFFQKMKDDGKNKVTKKKSMQW